MILLVEDDMNDAELTTRTLNKNHIANTVVHVKDGAAALDFLFCKGAYADRKTNITIKVILLDLKMPKVDGLEVLRAIKSDVSTKKIPVVVLTSSREHPDVEQAYLLGVNSYIVKPVDFENFTKSVAEIGMYWLLQNHPPA